MKTSLFETIRLFQYKDCQNCYHVSPAIQLLHIILRNFHCDAIILVVKLFWCVALELMTNSKCTPVQSQWALLKQESCGEVIKRLFSSAQHVSAQKAFLEENGCNADRYSACNVIILSGPIQPVGVVVKTSLSAPEVLGSVSGPIPAVFSVAQRTNYWCERSGVRFLGRSNRHGVANGCTQFFFKSNLHCRLLVSLNSLSAKAW